MSLSDTASYWWDVKATRAYNGIQFTHIPNSTCGHFKPQTGNTNSSKYLGDINCFACLKLIKQNGNIYGLQEGHRPSPTRKKKKKKQISKHGNCICGARLVERTNSMSGQKFLGCSTYPKCTNTKSLK